jgi:DNA-binding SARP family transcriptional activator
MDAVCFRVLGPVEVVRSGRPIPLGGSTVLTFLASLLLAPNEVVPMETLVDAVWEARLPDHPRAALHNAISRTRKAIRDIQIETLPWGYQLRTDADHHDLLRFNQLYAEAANAMTSGQAEKAEMDLESALKLWRMPPLANISSSSLARSQTPHLTERYLAAMEKWVSLRLQLGRYEALPAELSSLVRLHPLREQLTAYLMIVLTLLERRPDAVAAYHALRHALNDQLGIDPSPALQELCIDILRNGHYVNVPSNLDPWRRPGVFNPSLLCCRCSTDAGGDP